MQRFSVYVRSASASRSEIDRQVRACRAAGTALRLLEGGTYVDSGQSGLYGKCPARLEMMKAADQGDFDNLVIVDLDRLSRDRNSLVVLMGALQAAGVQVHTLDGPAHLADLIGEEAAQHFDRLSHEPPPSIQEQVEHCRAMAHRLGFELVAIHTEAV